MPIFIYIGYSVFSMLGVCLFKREAKCNRINSYSGVRHLHQLKEKVAMSCGLCLAAGKVMISEAQCTGSVPLTVSQMMLMFVTCFDFSSNVNNKSESQHRL